MVRPLRSALRYRGDQQHVLSTTARGGFRGMGAAGAARVSLRDQVQPLRLSLDAAEKSRGNDRQFPGRSDILETATRTDPGPAAAPLERQPRAAGRLSDGRAAPVPMD